MKKIAFVLAVVLVFSFAAAAYAEEQKSYWEKATDFSSNPLVEAQQQQQQIVDKGGPFERIVATLLDVPINMAKAMVSSIAKLKPINELVFGHELWSEKEANFIRTWYWALTGVCLPFFLIVIISTGFKLLYGSLNPGARAEAIESIWRWFGAMALILIAPLATDLLLKTTWILVDGIKIAYEHVAATVGLSGTINDWGKETFSGDINIHTGSVLGTAIVKVFFVGIWWWFNIIYLIRKFVLTAMLCFTPLMALFWALNRNVPAFAIWLGELGSNALMPVAHALVLCMILGIVDVKNVSDGTWFQVLVAVMTFVPLTEMIRNSIQGLFVRWAGVDEAATAGRVTAAALGFGGILSLGRLAGTVTNKNLPGGGFLPGALGSPTPGGPSGPGSGGLKPVPTTAPMPVPIGGGRGGPVPTLGGRGAGIPVPTQAGGGPSPVPPGYTTTPSGLVVPAGAAGPAPGAPGRVTGQAGQPGGGQSGQLGGAGSGTMGQPTTWTGRMRQAAARYGPKVADGLVKAGAFAAGAVAGGVVRAGLGAVPGLAPAGERLGGAVGRGTAYAVRGAAGLAVLGGRVLRDISKKDEEPKIFNPKEAGKTLHGVASGRAPLSAVMQVPIYRRPNAPKYQASVGGLDKRIA